MLEPDERAIFVRYLVQADSLDEAIAAAEELLTLDPVLQEGLDDSELGDIVNYSFVPGASPL